jgi:hypothetical protein
VARRGGAAWRRTLALLAAATLAASACGSPDRSGSQAGSDKAPDTTGSPSPTEPARPRLVRVTTQPPADSEANDEAPVERLGPVPPSNHTSYTRDADAKDNAVAASSSRATRRTASLWTSIPGADSRVEAELVNETEDRSLVVQGHVVYELKGPGGTTEHSSELLDLTLNPGEKVVVAFLLELPSGDYEASSSFRPTQGGGDGS